MSMLFDLLEVVHLVGTCFLVNYATAETKTNCAEGAILIAFYVMIVRSSFIFVCRPLNALLIVLSSCVRALDNNNYQ
jgi:hypothetical protein